MAEASFIRRIRRDGVLAPWLALALLATGCAHTGAPVATSWRAAGPLIEGAREPDAQADLLAVRPFFSHETAGDAEVMDLLWPLATWHRRGVGASWRALLAYGADADVDDPESAYFIRIFPFYFEGRTRAGEEYHALFPLGGTICGLPSFDRARFVLFPLYGDSQTRDTRTVTWLWPLFLTRHGDELDQWRLFPLYGVSRRTGELTLTRRFVLWPLWTAVHYDGERVQGDAFVLFPLYGQADLGDERSWMLLPPFFSWTRNEAQDYRRLRCPWPLVQWERRGADSAAGLWPLYGERQTAELSRWYALWPIIRSERVTHGSNRVERFHVTPVFYQERRAATAGLDEAREDHYWRLWPLLSWSRQGAASRLRVLELTWFRNSQAIERNWAPFWSLFVRRREADGASRNDLLWGLAAWGRQADGGGYFRLLGLPLAGAAAPAEGEETHDHP